MCEPVTFRDEDYDNIELARQIVLRRLKMDTDWCAFDRTWADQNQDVVRFEANRLRKHFVLLANEILWRLIFQGVLTIGRDADNLDLPWFRVTAHGQKVLDAERFVPHDPTGYLDELRSIAGPLNTAVAISYVEEALACYLAGCNVASTLLLGVAAESAFNELCDSVRPTLNAADQASLELTVRVKARHRWLVGRYENLSATERGRLPESLDITLKSLYDLIRRQRNDLGHPQPQPPQTSREEAFVFFRLLPTFIQDGQALATYCSTNAI